MGDITSKDRSLGGQPRDKSDSEILAEVKRINGDSEAMTATAKAIGDSIGYGKSGTLDRLRPLAEKGYLKSADVADAKVWWLTEKGREVVETA